MLPLPGFSLLFPKPVPDPQGLVLLHFLPSSPLSGPKSLHVPAEGWDSLWVSCSAWMCPFPAACTASTQGKGESSFPTGKSNPPPDTDVPSVGMGSSSPRLQRGKLRLDGRGKKIHSEGDYTLLQASSIETCKTEAVPCVPCFEQGFGLGDLQQSFPN